MLFITERCVFELSGNGLELIEVAPGIDVDRDILGQMEFKPRIANTLKTMDPRCFMEALMGLNGTLASVGWLFAAMAGGWMYSSVGFEGFGPTIAVASIIGAALVLTGRFQPARN